jgi:hypothetical protein
MKKRFALPLMSLLLAAPLAAQPASAPTPKKATKPAADKKVVRTTGTAFIRVLHAMPGGPSVDVMSGSTKIGSALTFKELSPYTEVKSGKNAVKVMPTGKTDLVISRDKALTKDKYYTVAIMGKSKAALMFVNESAGKAMPEKARVRAVHLAPGAPDVLVTMPSTRAKAGYTKFGTKPLTYGAASSKTMAPTDATIQIRTEDGKIVKEVTGLKLEAGKTYSLFAVGEVGSTFDILAKPAGK